MRSNCKALPLVVLLCFALAAAAACNTVGMTTVTISGRVVIEGSGQPLANHDVELWTLKLPPLPVGMGSYVKKDIVRTDSAGRFLLAAEVPRNRPFELRTSNPGTVFGGGGVNLDPASSITDVTIMHKVSAEPKGAPSGQEL